jgi:hypothetical protein
MRLNSSSVPGFLKKAPFKAALIPVDQVVAIASHRLHRVQGLLRVCRLVDETQQFGPVHIVVPASGEVSKQAGVESGS